MLQKNKIESLIKRAISCKPSIWPLKREEIDKIAKQLNVCFSKDFYQINGKCDYEGFYGACIEFCCFFINGDSGVVEYTKEFRQAMHLPHRYVVLSYTGDTRFVLMETQDTPDKNTPILDIEPEDLDNLIQEKPLEYDYTIWPSFTDFFEYLVEQEEEAIQKETK